MNSATRRAALIGAATLPALALPAVPALAADPDAELVAVGKRFAELVALYNDAQKRSRPQWDAIRAAMDEVPPYKDGENFAARSKEILGTLERIQAEFPIAFPECDDVMEMIDEPSRRIMALPAKTIRGLAVKAALVAHSCSDFWDEPDERADWTHLTARSLVDAILALDKAA